MEKIKKIWLWVSGVIVSFIGLFFIFSKISDSNKEKKEFKNKKKGLEKDFKTEQRKVVEVEKNKKETKSKIKKNKEKIKKTKSEIKDTNKAVEILKDFKEKHKK